MLAHQSGEDPEPTGADALIASLDEIGVEYIFANLGSDHPSIIEALALRHAAGEPSPRMVLCPHEVTALSAAHGYAAATGRPQAVVVHTDVGTANLGGSVHNVARSRVPAIIIAGLTPYTLEGELPGSRTIHANYLQDVAYQHDIVRPYMKWAYDLRTSSNIKQIAYRAHQIATSAPQGPVYLSAAREVLAETSPSPALQSSLWSPVAKIPAPSAFVEQLLEDLGTATLPIILTTYLGRSPAAVPQLVRLAETLGIAVVETVPYHMNFPGGHPLQAGYENQDLIAAADLILAIDTDVPSIPAKTRPDPRAKLYLVDDDPLKLTMPLWYWPAHRFVQADSEVLLHQLLTALQRERSVPPETVEARRRRIFELHDRQRETWAATVETHRHDGELTAELVCDTLRRLIDEETIVVDETITSRTVMSRYLPRSAPGTLYGNGGTALGWAGGAALGIKMASPNTAVVSIVGDGSYYLGAPSSTYWASRHYGFPFLTVILNNGGWNATKQNLLAQYPAGAAAATDHYWVNLAQEADLAGIAAASGGALAEIVEEASALETALARALECVGAGRSAVIEVRLAPVSAQSDA